MTTIAEARQAFMARSRPVDSGCIEFQSRPHTNGYGRLRIAGRVVYAHRYAWFLFRGEWPPIGLCVCHHCDNPICVNPQHLFLGVNRANQQDRIAKSRGTVGLPSSVTPVVEEAVA